RTFLPLLVTVEEPSASFGPSEVSKRADACRHSASVDVASAVSQVQSDEDTDPPGAISACCCHNTHAQSAYAVAAEVSSKSAITEARSSRIIACPPRQPPVSRRVVRRRSSFLPRAQE